MKNMDNMDFMNNKKSLIDTSTKELQGKEKKADVHVYYNFYSH